MAKQVSDKRLAQLSSMVEIDDTRALTPLLPDLIRDLRDERAENERLLLVEIDRKHWKKEALESRAEIEGLRGIVEKLCGPHSVEHVAERLDNYVCCDCAVPLLDEADGGEARCRRCLDREAAEAAKGP